MTTIPAATSHKKTGCDALILPQADLQPRWDVSFLKPMLNRRWARRCHEKCTLCNLRWLRRRRLRIMLGLSMWIEVSPTSLLKLQVGDDQRFRGGSDIAASRHGIAAKPPRTTNPKKHAMTCDVDFPPFLPRSFFLCYSPLFALHQKLDYNCLRRIRSPMNGYDFFDDSGSW